MKASRCIPLFAGAVALVISTTAHASSTSTKSSTATTSSAHAAKSAAPAKSTAAHTQAAAASTPTDENFAAIRQSLEESRHNLRSYHWKETIVVSHNGEDKSTLMNSCVYDASGKVVRTPEPVPASAPMNGVRGATPSAEKASLQAYEHSAVALLRSYVPPDPAKLRKCWQAGRMTTNVIEAGHRVKLSFKDYEKPGDEMMLEVNPASHQVLSVAVNSFLASAKDAVTMNADMASLPDGTSYPSKVQLNTPAKQMGLTVTNSDYQKKTS
ncbi:MAG TPA: hypothetical protein VFH33_06160 [Candidatus Krumholzibacteria bacterium]|nr:hypothetical protein [Candidatus Krumholzibacteria bacterium]